MSVLSKFEKDSKNPEFAPGRESFGARNADEKTLVSIEGYEG